MQPNKRHGGISDTTHVHRREESDENLMAKNDGSKSNHSEPNPDYENFGLGHA